MTINKIQHTLLLLFFLGIGLLCSCRTSTAPPQAEKLAYKSQAPYRVDIRGRVVMSRYDQGQVMMEVEQLVPSADSRYIRAFVLVQPTAQMVDADGNSISISQLYQGQNVAILLRGGGKGDLVGVGVARKLWLEEPL